MLDAPIERIIAVFFGTILLLFYIMSIGNLPWAIRRLMGNRTTESPEGLLYARSADIYLDDFKDAGVALAYYRQALEYGHIERACLEGIARCHMVLGDSEQAYSYYKQYVDAGYFSITMSINYAFLLIQRGEQTEALSYLERAYTLSKNPDVRNNLQKYINHTKEIIENSGLTR